MTPETTNTSEPIYIYRGLLPCLLLLFVVNPFWGFVVSLYLVRNKICINQLQTIYVFISLFMALVAFTQVTDTGDITRVYESIVSDNPYFKRAPFDYLLENRNILFNLMNQLLYTVIGDVRIVSSFWIFILYFFTYKAIINILSYKELELEAGDVLLLTSSVVFCFIFFSQVTEIMKQGVATALFLYAFSCILLNKTFQAVIVMVIASLIHLSSFFFLPVLLIFVCPGKIIYIIFFISFLFRTFNLMSAVIEMMGHITGVDIFLLTEVQNAAEAYENGGSDNFFSSSSLFFVVLFWHFTIFTAITAIVKGDSILINACLIMIIILNLSFSNDHNYTRLLTMLFPFYIFIMIELLECEEFQWQRIVIYSFCFILMVFNFRMLIGRFVSDTYRTSFLDNSLLNLISYPSFMYFM